MKQENEKFCQECGETINIKAEICPKCGVRQPGVSSKSDAERESENRWLTAILLCWFLGVFGIHRFYTGHTGIGIIQLLTGGGCGIWFIIDLVMLFTGSYTDADGNPIKK